MESDLLASLHCSIVMVTWASADSSKYIVRMFPFLCRSTSGRRSSITNSCRGGRGRRRRDRGRRSIWPAGKGNGTRARATLLGITTMIKVRATNHGWGAEAVGVGDRTNPRDPALCWPTIMWWSWNRSSRCRISSPRVVPAPLSRPPAVSQSCLDFWASNFWSHLKTRRRALRRLQLMPQPQQQQHHLHHQVAALRSVLSHPAKPSTLENCLTLGSLRGEHVWMEPRCPDLGKAHQKDSCPGLTWTAFPTRSRRLEERGPRTGIQQTWTRPVLKSSSSRENSSLVTPQWTNEVFTVVEGLTYPLCCHRPCVEVGRRGRNWWEMTVALVCFFAETTKQALKESPKPSHMTWPNKNTQILLCLQYVKKCMSCVSNICKPLKQKSCASWFLLVRNCKHLVAPR